jgi:putative peptidoglycan lipid II flippase
MKIHQQTVEEALASLRSGSQRSAALVAAGILLSRLAGLIRIRVFAHFFGLQSDAADAFNAAFRIPNFLQNLFGEGALSASFIPVYARLLAQDNPKEADRVAGAVGASLALIVAILVLAGVLAAPLLCRVLAPGFTGEKLHLTIHIVRVLFPGAGLLVLSAWCLGVLNSHRRFLLSYSAPIMWNAAMIGTLLWFGAHSDLPHLAAVLAWGSVAGSALQFGIQLPAVLRVAPHLRMALDPASGQVRLVARNFLPVFVSRGVVQLSAFIDVILASLLPTGAVTGLSNAQVLYTLPVSLFGMSVSAAELPAMAGATALADNAMAAVRERLDAGLRQIAYFVVPSSMAFLVLGDIVAAALLQTGRFAYVDAIYVWGILAGSTVGLLAQTLGRLYSSTYYALGDTRTPLRYALVRVVLTTVMGYVAAVHLPGWIGIRPIWGAAGLTASAGAAGWVEMLLLRRSINQRIGRTGLAGDFVARIWGAAIAGAAVAWMIKLTVGGAHPVAKAVMVLTPYGLVYLGATWALGVPEATGIIRRVLKRGR